MIRTVLTSGIVQTDGAFKAAIPGRREAQICRAADRVRPRTGALRLRSLLIPIAGRFSAILHQIRMFRHRLAHALWLNIHHDERFWTEYLREVRLCYGADALDEVTRQAHDRWPAERDDIDRAFCNVLIARS